MAKTSPSRPPFHAGRAAAGKVLSADKERYGAPALEKGLDVLELLAGLSQGVSQSEIAQLLGRSLQEVYRVVMVLERRGFIQRRQGEDGYFLSHRMFDLANRYPPLSRLVTLATPLMHQAAMAANQSLHMAILDSTSIRIVAQVDSPAPFGFRLRVGTRNVAMATASGRLLVALQAPAIRDWMLDEMRHGRPKEEADALVRRTGIVRTRGYEMVAGESFQGITDVSFPLIDSSGIARAALTMPYLAATRQTIRFDEACEIVAGTAATITGMLGGVPPKIRFPLRRIAARPPPRRSS